MTKRIVTVFGLAIALSSNAMANGFDTYSSDEVFFKNQSVYHKHREMQKVCSLENMNIQKDGSIKSKGKKKIANQYYKYNFNFSYFCNGKRMTVTDTILMNDNPELMEEYEYFVRDIKIQPFEHGISI